MTEIVERCLELVRAIPSCEHKGAIEDGATYCPYCGAHKKAQKGKASFWARSHVGRVARELVDELPDPELGAVSAHRATAEEPVQ